MAAEGIYGATTDGVEKYDLNTFKHFYSQQRPILAGILAAEFLLVGLPL